MSRHPPFQTKLVAGRLVNVPSHQHGSYNSYNSHPGHYTNNNNGYMASYSRNHDVDDLEFYRQGRSMNWTANIEAQSNKARALAQTYHSVLSPQPEEDTIVARQSTLSKGILKRISVCLENVTEEKLQTSFYTIAKLDNHHIGKVSVRDLWDVLLLYQIMIPSDLLEVIISHFKVGNGKIDYRQLWKLLYDCLPHRDYSDGDIIPVRDSSSYCQSTSNYQHHQQKYPNDISTISKLDPELFCQLHEELKSYAQKEQHLLSLSQLLSSLKNCDRGGTGMMGYKEMKVLCNFYLPLPDLLLDAIINQCDTNRNGWVNYLEFLSHLQSAQPTYLPPIYKNSSKEYQDDSHLPDIKSTDIQRPPATASGAPNHDEYTNSHKEQSTKSNRKTWKSSMSTPGWVMRKAISAKLEQLPLLEKRRKWENSSPVVSLRTLRQRTHSVDDISDNSALSSACSLYRDDSLSSTRSSAISRSELDLSKIDALHIESLSPEPDTFEPISVSKEPQRILKRRGTYTKSSDVHLKQIFGWMDENGSNTPLPIHSSYEIAFSYGFNIILLNVNNNQQRFYNEHTANIQCFCSFSTEDLVASVQMLPSNMLGTNGNGNEDPNISSIIHIWRPSNLERIATFDSPCYYTIIAIGLLNKDTLILVDSNQQVTILKWRTETKMDSQKIGGDSLSFLSVSTFNEQFLTITKDDVLFWNAKDGTHLSNRKGNYKNHPVSKTITSGCFISTNQAVTGDTSGTVVIWNTSTAEAQFCYQSVHSGSVTSLIPFTSVGTWLSSSSAANSITMWMINDKKFSRINLAVDKDCGIHSMVLCKQDYVICCLTNNSIWRVKVLDDSISELSEASTAILKGVSQPISLLKTFGANGILAGCKGGCIYCYQENNNLLWLSKIKGDPAAIEITATEKYILCGDSTGRFYFLDTQSGRCLETCKLGTTPIKTMFVSPDDCWVCVGFEDCRLSLFDLDSMTLDVSFTRQIQLPSSEIETFDWSKDQRNIRVQIKNHNIMLYDLKDGSSDRQLKNMDSMIWSTDFCLLQHFRDTYLCTATSLDGKCRAYGHKQGVTIVRYTGSYPQQPVSTLNIGPVKMIEFSTDGLRLYGVRENGNTFLEWTF